MFALDPIPIYESVGLVVADDPCAPIVDIDSIFDDESSAASLFKQDAFQPMPLRDIIASSGTFDLRDTFRFQLPLSPCGNQNGFDTQSSTTGSTPDAINSDHILSQVLHQLEDAAPSHRQSQRLPPMSAPQSHSLLPLSAPAMTAPPSFKHLRPCAKPKRRVVSDESACDFNNNIGSGSNSNNNCHENSFSSNFFDEDRASFPVKRQLVDDKNTFDNLPSSEEEGKFRLYQAEKWHLKFQELIEYKKLHGHTQVPHGYKRNPALARWAKRQRYQYKLFQENKPSTMTEERVAALEGLGFVWDSHSALWDERYHELKEYVRFMGHANVPSTYPPNPKLAIWVKCQRRQYKLLLAGQPSNMTHPRVDLLNHLNFVWEIRRTGYL